MYLIYAPNVRSGGGLSLLKELLAVAKNYHGIIDERAKPYLPGIGSVSWVPPGLGGRIKAELWLRRKARGAHSVLCFHNLPPLSRLAAPFDIYLQNRFVIDGSLKEMTTKAKLRIIGERELFRRRAHYANRIFVQTPTMAKLVREKVEKVPVILAPFGPEFSPLTPGQKSFDFCYPATPGVHKNHRVVAEALKLLGAEGIQVRIAVTAPTGSVEREIYLAAGTAPGIVIETLEYLPSTGIAKLYSESRALLFASTFESFGLPLIEARNAGLDIIAPELDYVRDVCRPAETFDPSSATSLARAIKRYLHVPHEPINVPGAASVIPLFYGASQL